MKRTFFTNIFLLGISIAFLWFLSHIWIYGSHYIQEPNKIILAGETLLLLGLAGFAIFNIIKVKEDS